MTTPRDAIGLSERLREVHKQLASHIGKKWLKPIDEAANQLDALSAENKKLTDMLRLVRDDAMRLDHELCSTQAREEMLQQDVEAVESRATRAEQERDELQQVRDQLDERCAMHERDCHRLQQERDEAYERAAKVADETATIIRSYPEGRRAASAIAAVIRRLAAESEREGK